MPWKIGVLFSLIAAPVYAQPHNLVPETLDVPLMGDVGLLVLAVGAGLVGSRAIRKYLGK